MSNIQFRANLHIYFQSRVPGKTPVLLVPKNSPGCTELHLSGLQFDTSNDVLTFMLYKVLAAKIVQNTNEFSTTGPMDWGVFIAIENEWSKMQEECKKAVVDYLTTATNLEVADAPLKLSRNISSVECGDYGINLYIERLTPTTQKDALCI